MKNISIAIIVICFLTCANHQLLGQKKEIQKAKRFIKLGEYHKAIPYLHLALNKNATDPYASYLLGYCYREVEDYAKAHLFFEHSNAMAPGTFKDIYLRIAESFHMNNEFEKAIPYYELHKMNTTGDSVALMDIFIKQCNNGVAALKDTSIVEVSNLGPFVNTRYSEYAPVFNEDFTKMRFTSRRPRKGHKQYTFAAYHSDIKEDIYEAELETSTNIWHKTQLHQIKSKRHHEAAILTSPDGNEMFMYISKNGGDIYSSKKVGNKWSKPQPVPNINSKSWEPSFAFNAAFDTIYFSSDRPGGTGGLDLYFSVREGNGWSQPQPLSSINSPYDDDAPFVNDGYLYFSSRSDRGIGGYDIFRVPLHAIDSLNIEWFKYPLNTGADDIFFSIYGDAQIGYFSSGRAGGNGGLDLYKIDFNPPYKDSLLALMDENATKDSLYAAYKSGKLCQNVPSDKTEQNEEIIGAPVVLRGHTFDLVTGKPIAANLKLIDPKTQEVLQTVSSDPKTGKFIIPALSGKKYKIDIDAPNYLRYFEDFFVEPGQEINVKPKHISLQASPMGNKIILAWHFFDFDKSSLRSEAIPELENLIQVMKVLPTVRIKIIGHTCSDGSEAYNLKLSESRASSVKQYLIDKGIEPSRMDVEGKGESSPLYDNNNPRLKPWNRRVEIFIVD